ncbi:MAG TPA: hypothetical protein VHA54_12255, partial [Solirubrobacterales bacterium]|nr:hypothetical protein [Solirubrobacterales bacterium]
GARPAGAALACAGADVDRAALMVDLGGRAPRPTLLASAAAQRLEERLAAHLPEAQVAARGQVCQLVAPADEEGFEIAQAAMTVARDEVRVVHVVPAALQPLLGSSLAADLSGALLRADVGADQPLLALAAHDLLARGLVLAVLKRRLPWVTERRALFGALPAGTAGGLPPKVVRRLLGAGGRGDDEGRIRETPVMAPD